jgi:hypothetical protein
MIKNTVNHNINILNEKFGTILSESFVDPIQFKIFLKMVDGALNLKEDLSFYDGNMFLVHIPHIILVDSVITTSTETLGVSDIVKSKIEALVTR